MKLMETSLSPPGWKMPAHCLNETGGTHPQLLWRAMSELPVVTGQAGPMGANSSLDSVFAER